mmetsp:Transcript_29406/g.75008  ORF Transcript_29406/g.75008 Transcript_29406/m.75008 type:complete len:202 (+) Transcript_29406:1091-1696(+)
MQLPAAAHHGPLVIDPQKLLVVTQQANELFTDGDKNTACSMHSPGRVVARVQVEIQRVVGRLRGRGHHRSHRNLGLRGSHHAVHALHGPLRVVHGVRRGRGRLLVQVLVRLLVVLRGRGRQHLGSPHQGGVSPHDGQHLGAVNTAAHAKRGQHAAGQLVTQARRGGARLARLVAVHAAVREQQHDARGHGRGRRGRSAATR